MTTLFDVLLVALPLTALGNAIWRAGMNPGAVIPTFRTGFLGAGVALFLLALVSSSGLFGNSFAASDETLDITVKVGFGMMLGALVCAVAERRKDNHASGGGAWLRDDRDHR
ncbi:hypothetical protein [Nonomuraea aurantiaca]|uniref:hypothetical protein n=1 Tax=Nonomuraea aurantiaca TaxID=2878562 RepID=UPI001CD99310|nr:hypothetical protein [Nonomuraea aurantiaca]MCA2223485.1 hypothetical protein [Nonomuraea aurantiaca]